MVYPPVWSGPTPFDAAFAAFGLGPLTNPAQRLALLADNDDGHD